MILSAHIVWFNFSILIDFKGCHRGQRDVLGWQSSTYGIQLETPENVSTFPLTLIKKEGKKHSNAIYCWEKNASKIPLKGFYRLSLFIIFYHSGLQELYKSWKKFFLDSKKYLFWYKTIWYQTMLFTINMVNLDNLLKISEPQFFLGKIKITICLKKLAFVS